VAITSVSLGALDIHDGVDYASGEEMAYALEAIPPRDPVAVDMADRYPFYVRQQIQPKTIPVVVYLLGATYSARKTAWDALATAALGDPIGIVQLTWNDGSSHTLDIHVDELQPNEWFSRVSGQAVAFNPVPR